MSLSKQSDKLSGMKGMKTNAAFWDTSVIVPLCVRQDISQDVRRLWRKTSRVVVWWGTSIEVRSAISRLYQGNFIDSQGLQFALARLELIRRKWAEIVPSEKMRQIAETLPDAYGLRALDSCQLAAALVWCNEKPNGRLFICDDAKLSEAARKLGFSIKP
jgi:uncharacterized protein